jgi:hypothetical protein
MTPAHATHTHAVGLRHLCLRLLRQIQFRRGEVGSSAMRLNLVARPGSRNPRGTNPASRVRATA